MAFWPRRNSTNIENSQTTHVLDQNTAKPLWCVKHYQLVCAALTSLVLLHSRNIRDCLRLILVSEPRTVVKVSHHTFSMTLCWNPMQDSPALWLSELLSECVVILDRLRSMARGAMYCSNWPHIWDHSTKAVDCFPRTTAFPLLFAPQCILWSLSIHQSKVCIT